MTRLTRPVSFAEFLKVLRREGRPAYLPFYEHIASLGFISRRLGVDMSKVPRTGDEFWQLYVDFWLGMGYDGVPLEIGLNCPVKQSAEHGLSRTSEALAMIASREDFEQYPWPDVATPIDFKPFEIVAGLLPDGVKIVGGVGAGPYEWVTKLMGVMGLSYALADDPGLVADLFRRIGELHTSGVRQLASMDAIGVLRQGDDLGFKTATFLSPAQLRQYVFPIYTRMVAEAHAQGKPFILHSCGNLGEVYDDLIDGCQIDAKHSFEDVIMPVGEFKRQYGGRCTPIGGLDVDVICRASEHELRAYTRRHIEECFHDGYWALGTGNSLTDYMPVENYLVVLDEGMKAI